MLVSNGGFGCSSDSYSYGHDDDNDDEATSLYVCSDCNDRAIGQEPRFQTIDAAVKYAR